MHTTTFTAHTHIPHTHSHTHTYAHKFIHRRTHAHTQIHRHTHAHRPSIHTHTPHIYIDAHIFTAHTHTTHTQTNTQPIHKKKYTNSPHRIGAAEEGGNEMNALRQAHLGPPRSRPARARRGWTRHVGESQTCAQSPAPPCLPHTG
jgi:hypothetical protein